MEDKDSWAGIFFVIALLFAIAIGIFVVLPAQQAELKRFCASYNNTGIHDSGEMIVNCSALDTGLWEGEYINGSVTTNN